MPYLCRVAISGPEAGGGGVSTLIDAVADAVKNGWDAPLASVLDEESDDELSDEESPGGDILDHRILGYPGGAIARAYAGHTDNTGPATTTYIKADLQAVAAALAALTGQPHPLAASLQDLGIQGRLC